MRTAVVMSLIAGALLGAPVPARAAGGVLVAEGSDELSTITVSESVSLDLKNAVIHARGSYGGIVVYGPKGQRSGVITFPALSRSTATGTAIARVNVGGSLTRLEPGIRYRVLVLGDEVTDVTVPLSGGTPQYVLAPPGAPVATTFAAGSTPLVRGRNDRSARLPIGNVRKPMRLVSLGVIEGSATEGQYSVKMCAAVQGRRCAKSDTTSWLDAGGAGPSVAVRNLVGFSVPWRFASGRRDLVGQLSGDFLAPAEFRYGALTFVEPW
ncbi:MAG TPA: hypothetical protein VNA20_14330 [Frankiaceae bacterium]|nr:hypothetical protein [Frankiaceae bacterium]